MANITISKTEYEDLKGRAEAYGRMIEAAQVDFSLAPPEKSKKKIIAAFRKTGKYTQKFLDSLNKGLKRSTYFTA